MSKSEGSVVYQETPAHAPNSINVSVLGGCLRTLYESNKYMFESIPGSKVPHQNFALFGVPEEVILLDGERLAASSHALNAH